MIEVINREIIIPREEYNIGTCYDDNTETRHFHLKRVTSGGVDLAALTFNLDIQYADGNTDAASLVKEVTDKDINLVLTINNSMLQVPGTVLIQIRALDEDGVCKWTSYKSAFFVEDHINTPGHYEGDLTQLEQYEAEWGKVRDNVNQLNLRMDQIARISEESPATEVEEEVVDARVGADNVVYGSLGTAIRKQFENVYEEMEDDTGDWTAAVAAEAAARAEADTAEATARQTADNTLQGNINSEASTRATQDGLLQSQIDQIIAPSGEAPSASEVQNARIGADGVTYDTLGNAIRGQISAISAETRNIVDFNYMASKSGITISDSVISGTAGSFNSAFGASTAGILPNYAFETNARYSIFGLVKTDAEGVATNGLIIKFVYTDTSEQQIVFANNTTNYTVFALRSIANKTISKIVILYVNGSANVWHLKNLQIESGVGDYKYIPPVTATDYIARENISILSEDTDYVSNVIKRNDERLEANWVNGNYNDITGIVSYDNTTRVISSKYAVKSGDAIKVTIPTGYQFKLCRWASDGSFISNGSWYTSSQTITIPSGTGIISLMCIMITNPTDINPDTFAGAIEFISVISVLNKEIEDLRDDIVAANILSAKMYVVCTQNIGDCVIFKFNDNTTLFVDTGEDSNKCQTNLQSAITELQITHIDHLIISHWHIDHVGNLGLLSSLGLIDENTTCYLPQAFTADDLVGLQSLATSVNDRVYQSYMDNKGYIDDCIKVYPSEGQAVTIANATVDFWNTNHTPYLTAINNHTLFDYNPCSLCNYVTIGNFVVCCSGDINLTVMNEYATKLRPCNIYKANHHSVGYVSVPKFLNAVCPDIVMTSLGPSLISMLAQQADSVQTWCEANNVPNFVTGIMDANIKLNITANSYRFLSNARKYIIADET